MVASFLGGPVALSLACWVACLLAVLVRLLDTAGAGGTGCTADTGGTGDNGCTCDSAVLSHWLWPAGGAGGAGLQTRVTLAAHVAAWRFCETGDTGGTSIAMAPVALEALAQARGIQGFGASLHGLEEPF